ncbi:MAG: roadblock/LC7 domain-containing protein [Chloroflexi bacterium]|nr:roadblock/LC7 domain-containing protein [Chloroflexota bacterium]
MAELNTVLERFLAIDGVTMATVVGTDGLIIETAGTPGFDTEAVSAVAASALGAAQSLAEEVTKGRLVQAMIEFERGVVIMEPIGELGVLLVLTESSASLGRVRLVARRERTAVEDALAA